MLRRAGSRIAFDSNYRPRLWASRSEAQAAVARALGLASLALPTFDDEAALFGDADPAATVRRLHGLGVEEVAVKCGPEPSLVSQGGQQTQVAVERDRKSTRLNSSHSCAHRMPSCACKKKKEN